MIIAAGLTPAWQQIVRLDGFRPAAVNRVLDVQWCASGKILNVGIALAHLGAPFETISLAGGSTGEQIQREFISLGIHAQWIPTHWATRVCTTILDIDSGEATELVENAGPVTADELARFAQVYAEHARQARVAILTGSLPLGTPCTFFRDLLGNTPCPAILDVRGDELRAALSQPVFLVKPNREELSHTVGRALETDGQLRAAMNELNQWGAQWVVITDGARPAWASSQGRCYRLTPPKLLPVNPIGAGDCLAAGIAWALLDGAAPLDAIRMGIAAGAESVLQLLPARLDPHSVRARADSIQAVEVFA